MSNTLKLALDIILLSKNWKMLCCKPDMGILKKCQRVSLIKSKARVTFILHFDATLFFLGQRK